MHKYFCVNSMGFRLTEARCQLDTTCLHVPIHFESASIVFAPFARGSTSYLEEPLQ